jgi:hypothetical protein
MPESKIGTPTKRGISPAKPVITKKAKLAATSSGKSCGLIYLYTSSLDLLGCSFLANIRSHARHTRTSAPSSLATRPTTFRPTRHHPFSSSNPITPFDIDTAPSFSRSWILACGRHDRAKDIAGNYQRTGNVWLPSIEYGDGWR